MVHKLLLYEVRSHEVLVARARSRNERTYTDICVCSGEELDKSHFLFCTED